MFDSLKETQPRVSAEAAPWVIVAGGFHQRGGMDKANAALARYLLARGTPLHLVAHAVAPELAAHPQATVHIVPRPAGSFLLGERLLAREGHRVARAVVARHRGARVVTNGGNCAWPDINWVHSVHHAWPRADAEAPLWFRAKNRLDGATARRRERGAISNARIVIANSERTRRDLMTHLDVKPERIRTVRLGSDDVRQLQDGAATREERTAAREWLGVPEGRPLVVFVGALGHDCNKGFDTLLGAWARLCARAEWDADLVAAGGGRAVAAWRTHVASFGLAARVKLLGHTERVGDVLAAADLLVSPVRYEAYGLNVHEAVVRGVPSLVSAVAGVAELYPAELSAMLLPDAEDAAHLEATLLDWRMEVEAWKRRFAPFAATLARRTWRDMAAEFVEVVEGEAAETSVVGQEYVSLSVEAGRMARKIS
ncbi:MAG TPA: glycosyltransferase family 4 protein [Pyrinomonadaceae bacterium]|jgi:glycosyltransferase involved in cell wall biosynthesis